MPENTVNSASGIRRHHETPTREWHSGITGIAYYMEEKAVPPITESCTTYYRILYYLLENPVLPITESCNTYYRKLWYFKNS